MNSKSLRITFVSPIGEIGGAERVLLDVISSLRPVLPTGSSMHVICLSDGPLLAEVRSLGATAEVISLPKRIALLGESGLRGTGRLGKISSLAFRAAMASPSTLVFLRRFRKAVVASHADVVHTNGVKAHLLARFLPKSAGCVIWHIHDLLGGRALLGSLLKYAAGRTTAAIAISQAVADDLKAILPDTTVYTVLNGIDTQHFSPGQGDRSMLDRLANHPSSDGVKIGLIATYANWKGQDVFLKAAAEIVSPATQFYIIGGTIYQTSGSQFSRPQLQKLAATLGIAERVGFVDFQPDPLPIYRALDVVVHASVKPEPFGRTIAEGMACGRAVIVSAAGGAKELFTEGADALGTIPGDVADLAATMRRMIGDAELRRALGDAARKTAVHRFDRERIGPSMLSIYQRACGTIPATPE